MGVAQKVAPRGSRRRKIARALAGRFLAVMRGLERRMLSGEYIAKENVTLTQSWRAHSPASLEAYLVSGYQNPRINAQSILARHYLIRQLFGDQFDALMKDELAFAVEANDAIGRRAQEMGVTMGVYMDPRKRAAVEEVCSVIADREDTYERLWSQTLATQSAPKLKVLELACGSANDYRYFDSYGLARFLDYTGIDLNEKNVVNAKKRFAGVRFDQGSILDLPYESSSFDYVIAFDIFEHLSLKAMERAMAEAVRVTKRGFLVAFFIMADVPGHTERPKKTYHWNELSADQIRTEMSQRFATVDLFQIRPYLESTFGFDSYYNPKAWSMFADNRR